jgi:cell division protein FtsB
MAEMEAENRVLRQRVESTRARIQDLLARLAFLEEQGRETAGGATGTGGASR